MKRILTFLLSMSILASITSCGPLYSTDYVLTPPKSQSGINCIGRCEDDQDACEESQNQSKSYCEEDNQRQVDDCNERIQREKNRGPKWTECGRQITCDYPLSECESAYRLCYKACGGQVREERKCVFNCDAEKPKAK